MSGERPTSTPGDDALREMLEGRASRLGVTDAREVRAAVRTEIAGPAAGADEERGGRSFGLQRVRVEPQVRGRGSRMALRLAVLGVAAVVVVAVLGSRLSLGPANPDAGASQTANAVPSPIETLTPEQLNAGVLGGSLIGRTVVVIGHLEIRLGACLAVAPPPDGCWWLVFPGLESRQIDPGRFSYDVVGLALARHGGDEPIALHVFGSEVDLLGWIVDGAEGPLVPTAFDAGTTPLDALELAVVRGWLTPAHGDASCLERVGGGCDGPHPRLTDTKPFLDGTWTDGVPGIDVSIPPSFGLDGDNETMVGRFLVGRGPAQLGGYPPPYGVVAALDAEVQRVDRQVTPVDATPAPSAPAPAAGHMTAEDFARAVTRGELHGRIVIVEGRMRLVIGRCGAGWLGDCTWLQLEGLPDIVIDKGDLDVDDLEAAFRRHPNVGPIALRVSESGPHLIGWISAGASTPVDVAALRAGDLPLDPGDVAVVAGWLLGAPASPPCSATPETCAMWPLLSPAEPIPGVILYGDTGIAVMVAESLGLPPAPATMPGPFVVAAWRAPSIGEPGFEVVERFVDVTTVDAPVSGSATPAPTTMPTPTPTAPVSPPAGVLTSDELMTALANGSLDGRLLALKAAELKTVAWSCPADVPEPCTRFYVDGLPGIALTYRGMIAGSDGSDGGAGVSTMSGTMIVVPRSGHLELLGRLDGSLEAPLAFDDAFAVDDGAVPDPFGLRPVSGWLIHTPAPSGCPPEVAAADVACVGDSNVISTQPPRGGSLPVSAVQRGVVVRGGPPGLEDLGLFIGGPFLVKPFFSTTLCPYGTGPCVPVAPYEWEVVARYDLAGVVQVLLP